MSETTYTVTGMTCGHCAASVAREVGGIQGVTNVAVHLSSGALTVAGDRQVDPAEVRAAVEEAGYRLAGLKPAPEGAGAR